MPQTPAGIPTSSAFAKSISSVSAEGGAVAVASSWIAAWGRLRFVEVWGQGFLATGFGFCMSRVGAWGMRLFLPHLHELLVTFTVFCSLGQENDSPVAVEILLHRSEQRQEQEQKAHTHTHYDCTKPPAPNPITSAGSPAPESV